MILAVGGYGYSVALSLAEAMEGVTRPLLLAPPWGITPVYEGMVVCSSSLCNSRIPIHGEWESEVLVHVQIKDVNGRDIGCFAHSSLPAIHLSL